MAIHRLSHQVLPAPRPERVFGASYPPDLQPTVDHADRFRRVVESADATPALPPAARRWLIGRADEMTLVLALLVDDWRAGRKTSAAAAREIGAYIDELHEGARALLGAAAPLTCCDGAATPGGARAADDEAVTRVLVPPVGRAGAKNATLFDPSALLDEGGPMDVDDPAGRSRQSPKASG